MLNVSGKTHRFQHHLEMVFEPRHSMSLNPTSLAQEGSAGGADLFPLLSQCLVFLANMKGEQ